MNVTTHTAVVASVPSPRVTLPGLTSTDTVPTLGMFSRPVKSSHAEAAVLISVEKYSPWQIRIGMGIV